MATPRKDGITRRDFLGVTGAIAGSGLLAGRIGAEEPAKGPAVLGPGDSELRLNVNGADRTVKCPPSATLLDVLRESLDLTGAKRVCDRGECGSCTVLLDGRPVYACMVLALQARGRAIRTIEGLEKNGELHPVQQAFIEHDGLQCGFCTPGQVMSAVALLENNPRPALDDIRAGMCGNLCRCSAYNGIFDAVASVAAKAK